MPRGVTFQEELLYSTGAMLYKENKQRWTVDLENKH